MGRSLEEWPVTQKYDPSKLAKRLKLSPSQIDRIFQEHLQMTPRQSLNHRRIDRARYVLSRMDSRSKKWLPSADSGVHPSFPPGSESTSGYRQSNTATKWSIGLCNSPPLRN